MTDKPWYLWSSPEDRHADAHRSIRVRDRTICIAAAAFRDFLQLQQVHLPMGLQMIGLEAFQDCLTLREINFPSSLIQIQDQAFKGCVSLLEAKFMDGAGLQLLGSEAFEGCVGLTTVVLPSTLTFLGTTVFSQCYRLSMVTMFQCNKLEVIPEEAFDNCSALTHLKLPPSIQVIEPSAFHNCVCLASIELPKGLEEIGTNAFSNCCTMVSLELPEGLEEMEQFALTSCTSLKNLRLLQPDYFRTQEGGGGGDDEDNDMSDDDDDDDYDQSPQSWDRLLEIFPHQNAIQRALYKRFDDLPLHKLCYHQIHYDSEEEVMKAFDSIRRDDLLSKTGTRADVLGMTPLHILALSAKPNSKLFWTILENYPVELILRRDAWKKSCIDYLSLNKTPNPKPNLLELGAKLLAKQEQGAQFSKNKRLLAIGEVLKQDFESSNAIKHRKRMVTMFYQLAVCQKMENLCTLELALWKAALLLRRHNKICEPTPAPKRAKIIILDREEVRISCGADVVLSNVLSFMDKIES